MWWNSALFLISSMALLRMLPMLTLLLWNGYDADLRVLSIHAERKKEKKKKEKKKGRSDKAPWPFVRRRNSV